MNKKQSHVTLENIPAQEIATNLNILEEKKNL